MQSAESCTNNVLRDVVVVVITLRLLRTIRCCNNSVRGAVEADACVQRCPSPAVCTDVTTTAGGNGVKPKSDCGLFADLTVLFKYVDDTSATGVDAKGRKHTDAPIRRNFNVSSLTIGTLSWLLSYCWASQEKNW